MDTTPDDYANAVALRFSGEMREHGYRKETQAAEELGKSQQWLNERQRVKTQWGASDLYWACQVLGLDHMYVATGLRKSDIVAEFLSGNSPSEIVNELRRRVPEVGDIIDEGENWPQDFSDGSGEQTPPVSRGNNG